MPISPQRILYEDESFLAVDKLSGELVVKGKGKVEKLPLYDFLKKQYPGIHPLHRLDFETSGVIVFAKNRKILKEVLDTNFAHWKKIYRTLVAGKIDRMRGEIRKPLPARMGKGTVDALTNFTVLEKFTNTTYVEAQIETGRHHQIRKHFAAIGYPLALDDEYGDKKFNKAFTRDFHLRRFFLHAWRLEFPNPTNGKVITIEAPMPRIFEGVLKQLRAE